jgi:hypothetical protein
MLREDIEILDDMIGTLVDLLVEKGIIKHEEYESEVKQRLKNVLQIAIDEEIVHEKMKKKR